MTVSDRAAQTAVAAARAASSRKAVEIVALDVSERLVLTDVFLIASGTNERQVVAIVEAVEESLHELGVTAVRREGVREAHWALLDFGEIVVHVQRAEDRMYYALERLWADCPVIELPPDARGGDGRSEREWGAADAAASGSWGRR
jgi:ribosome-associated protein